MIRRTVLIPARFLPALDAALDELRGRIERGEIPDWAQDDVPESVMLQVVIKRPAVLRLEQGAA